MISEKRPMPILPGSECRQITAENWGDLFNWMRTDPYGPAEISVERTLYGLLRINIRNGVFGEWQTGNSGDWVVKTPAIGKFVPGFSIYSKRQYEAVCPKDSAIGHSDSAGPRQSECDL